MPYFSTTAQVLQLSQTLLSCLIIYYSEVLKLLQLLLTVIGWITVTNLGGKILSEFGLCYDVFLGAVSGAMVTTFLLLLTRLTKHTSQKIRSSLFEIYFDGFYALVFLILSSSISLDTNVSFWGLVALAAQDVGARLISAMQTFGYILAVLYGIDFVLAMKYYVQNIK